MEAARALPATARLGAVELRVADLGRSLAWLERVLGFATLERGDGAAVAGGPDGRPWVRLRERAGLRRVPKRGLLGLYHYAVLLPARGDLGRFLAHLDAIGEPYGASDHWFSEALYLTDPDGITVEVYADRPRESWTWRGDDVLGAVDPLDTAGVLAAGAGGTWAGAPQGTRMGHLHFFVGDLARAERFYIGGLGFEASTRLFPGALFVSAGRYHHHVGVNVWAASQPVATDDDAGLDAWTLELPHAGDLEDVRARFGAAGIPYETGDGVLVARDAWGIRVRVVSE